MNTLCEAVALRIKHLLKEKGITQYRLAEDSGVQQGNLSGIMRGVNNSVDFLTIIKLAGGFNMPTIEFIDDPLFDEDNLKV